MSHENFLAPHASRRDFLLTAGAFAACAFVPKFASAAPARDPLFLTVILRGGMDGLAVVEPTFDPDFERVRNGLVLGANESEPGLDLGHGFLLNPKLAALHEMFGKKEAAIFHAVATPYRERSHFDGQDVLESGQPVSGVTSSGWLNRAMTTLKSEGHIQGGGISIGPTVPLVMRGQAPTMTWAAGGARAAAPDARARLLNLYKAESPDMATGFQRGLQLEAIAAAGNMAGAPPSSSFVRGMEMVSHLFNNPNGPRVGSIDLDGWDTHSDEKPTGNNLGKALAELDAGLAALKQGLGDNWKRTVVAIATEFGRTARMNGTEGTDHGTATVAFLVGGAVKGGRVITDWPGLTDGKLYQNRDLNPTTDVRSILKGALRDHLSVDPKALDTTVFPQSAAAKPMGGLVI